MELIQTIIKIECLLQKCVVAMFFVDAAAVVAGTVDTTAFFFSTKTHFNNAAAVQKHPKQNHSMIQGHPTMWI